MQPMNAHIDGSPSPVSKMKVGESTLPVIRKAPVELQATKLMFGTSNLCGKKQIWRNEALLLRSENICRILHVLLSGCVDVCLNNLGFAFKTSRVFKN